MNTPLLVTGKQGEFSADLVQEALNRSYLVLATHDSETGAPEVPDGIGDQLSYIPWSRRSLLSARSVVLKLDEQEDGVGHAIVVCSPEGINTPLHKTESALLEERIDATYKGYLFLLKELLSYFIRRGAGDLTLVLYDGGAEVMPPFDATFMAAMEGLAQSLFLFYESEPVVIRALRASDSETRSVAQWVLDSVFERGNKTAGRLSKYGQRGSLFPFRK